jgi:hypothetical protein
MCSMQKCSLITVVIALAIPAPHALLAQRLVVDAGVAQIGWLSPGSTGFSAGFQLSTPLQKRTALIGAVRTVSGLTSRGTGGERRDLVGSGLLGIEQELAHHARLNVHGSLGVAGSYIWSTYSGTATNLGRVGGFSWVRPVLAMRLEQQRVRGPRAGLRLDVQPRFDAPRSVNPTLGFSLSW